MPIVVGVSLRTAGRYYFFDPGEDQYHRCERVLVETSRGYELGTIKIPPHEVDGSQIVAPLKRVIRRADASDISRDALNRERETHALAACKRLVEKLNLPMRLIDAQYSFDGAQLLVHFTAENRVDFRELVRELARELHTRIELRQVGVRDEAKLLGGYGVCGRPLCCSSFLSNFAPVAINMAKVQGLALNPQKISGTCGRLICCLAFEYEHYKNLRGDLPKQNAQVMTPRGPGKVTKLNVIARQVEVMLADDPMPVWFSVDELQPAHDGCCATKTGACPHGQFLAEEESMAAVLDDSPASMTMPRGETTGATMVAENTGLASNESTPAAEKRRPRRRRRPKAPTREPESAREPVNTADGGENTQPRPKRPRQRKKRPATHAAPAQAPVLAGASTTKTPPATPVPSGRYRPRRKKPRE